ncbi:MAG: hypothetical protein IJ324_03630 [Lachnospiraceae bacterium]|nr:hypothetical protein [Lachnospiraceae bacterium]
MKTYETPALFAIEADTAEGIYAGSGAYNPTPTPDPYAPGAVTEDCWINWTCTWTGHNNGHHSVCNVTGNHCGNHSGSVLVLNFVTNFPIQEVKNASGLTISNVGTYSFTLTRNNHFNPTESVGFNFEIVTSSKLPRKTGGTYEGAIGEDNADAYYCKVASYTCG